jgi:hypothetical protein
MDAFLIIDEKSLGHAYSPMSCPPFFMTQATDYVPKLINKIGYPDNAGGPE